MPKFLIDFLIGQVFVKDEEGSHLANVQQAKNEAVGTLIQMAKDTDFLDEDFECVATVYDEHRTLLYTATLTLTLNSGS